MTIVDVQWHPYHVPFKTPFSTAHGILKARTGVIIEVRTEEGVTGIGEIAPLPEFKGTVGAIHLAPTAIAACLKGKTLHEALDIIAMTVGAMNQAPTTCGVEIALLDALGKVEHKSVGGLLCENVVGAQFIAPASWTRQRGCSHDIGTPVGAIHCAPTACDTPKTSLLINAVIGAISQDMAIAVARQAVNDGYTCIKLKVGMAQSMQEEVERVAAVRDAIGPEVLLRLDANEAWDVQQARAILSRCVPYDIEYVEQPVKADNLEAMRTLCRSVSIPIAADEAISDLNSARRVLENEAAAILIVKPQLAGGLRVGQQIVQEAARYGVQCVITSSIETGIGIVAALHLAATTPTITQACGFSTLNMLVDDLLVEDLLIQDGYMTVPAGDGLGVMLDRDALEIYKG